MSAPLAAIEGIEYSLALIHPGARTVLCSLGPNGSQRLPRLRIPTNVRVTVHLRNAIHAAWGLWGIVLDYLPPAVDCSRCAVIEVISEDLPPALRSIDLEDVPDDDLSVCQRGSLLSLFRRETETSVSRVGWLYEAIQWVEETSGEKISSILEIEQINAGQHFSLVRFPMRSGQSYWLKATGAPNDHEQPLTSFLSELCPDHIPEVLDVKPEWNAWIVRGQSPHPAFPSDDFDRLKALRHAVVAMAKLQLRSIEHQDELLAKGAFDQRLSVLRSRSVAFFECIREAMSRQTSTRVAKLDNVRLRDLHRMFDAACDLTDRLQIPPMVLHGDMSRGNVLYHNGHCQFIDWCETYIGHPLVTLQHLLLLNQPNNVQLKASSDAELIGCYRAVMMDVLDPNVFDQAMTVTPLLAAGSALYGRGDWFDLLPSLPSERQARIRMLARCMDRAAQEAHDLGTPSLGRLSPGGVS